MKRWVALLATVAVLGWAAWLLFAVQPSNQRDWEFGVDTLPTVITQGSRVRIGNIRDVRWTAAGGVSATNYLTREFDVDQIERVWFIQEPFGFEGVAHTYFVFDFAGQEPVGLSVEARREKGESYDVISGLFKKYELIYIWATEQDLTGRRALVEKHRLYMYPLQIPAASARALFLQLTDTTHDLEDHPRFYNSLFSNCTNELAKAANAVQPGVIPPNIALIMPGYSDRVLYERGFIPTDAPLETERQRYLVTDAAVAAYGQPDFSVRVRQALV